MKTLWRRLGLALLSIVLLLALAGFIVGRWYVAPFIREKLETGVAASSDSLYRLSIGPIHLNFLTGTVRAKYLVLSTDSVKWEALRREHTDKGTPRKIDLKVKGLSFIHVGWWHFHKTKHLALDAIEVERPSLEMTVFKDSVLTAKPKEDTITLSLLDRLPNLLAQHFNSLNVKELRLHHGEFLLRTKNDRTKRETIQSAGEVDWLLANVRISENDSTAGRRPLYADNILLDVGNYRMWSVGGRSMLQLGKLRLIGKDDLLRLSDCVLRNVSADSVHRAPLTMRKPSFQFSLPQLAVRGLDLFRALHRGEWIARAVEMENPKLLIWQNMDLPLPLWRKMPNEAFQQVDFPLSIDSVIVRDAQITYREKIDDERGQLTFQEAELLALNVSNDPHCMSDEHPARIYGSCQFMGTGDLSVMMEIPLLRPDFHCRFHAELRKMPMARLNGMIVPKANLKIEEGFIERVIASGLATSRVSTGSVRAYYGDLKVSVLDDSTKERRRFASFLANLAVRNDSEQQDKDGTPYRVEGFEYRRDAVDGFLRYIWRSIQSGLVKTLTPVKMDMPKNDGREKKEKGKKEEAKGKG